MLKVIQVEITQLIKMKAYQPVHKCEKDTKADAVHKACELLKKKSCTKGVGTRTMFTEF